MILSILAAESAHPNMTPKFAKLWKALNTMSKVWKSCISDDLKRRLIVATVESVLLYGCETWSLSSTIERSVDGTYTRMLRAALDISWQSHTLNEVLYASLPRASDKIAWRRLGLAGHCFRDFSLPGSLVLWEPRHGRRSRGRPPSTFVDTLKRDVATVVTSGASWQTAWPTGPIGALGVQLGCGRID